MFLRVGGQCQYSTDETQGRSVRAFVQQGYASQGQGHAEGGLQADLLLEHQGHDDGDHYGVDEEDGGCDTGFHEVVALEEGERGYGHQKSHDYESESLLAADPEGTSAGMNHDGQDGNGQEVSEKQY